MSTIARFLQAKEPLFDHALHQLEERTGRHNVDVKLAAEIVETVADRTRQLGLDPADTTGRELYAALLAQVHKHDAHLAKAIGGTDPEDMTEMIPLIVAAAESARLPKQAWVLREDKARAMLLAHPPLEVMKLLGHHLVSDLLDKEDIYELMVSLRFAQDAAWLNDFDATYRSLVPGDFERRAIKIVVMRHDKWGDIALHFTQKKRHNITHSKEMGVIAVLPMAQTRMKGVTLKVMPLFFHYFNEIRLYSSFFQLMKTKANFGEIVADTLIADSSHVPLMAGRNIHWRVLQRYYGRLPGESHPEQFEPHVMPEDLHWRKAEEVLYEIDPELAFWRDLDYVATLKDGQIITLALMDNSFNFSNDTDFEHRNLYHFTESLWNEVFARYMGQRVLEEQLLVKLDNAIVKPETLPIHG